jgi:hypothetical protein
MIAEALAGSYRNLNVPQPDRYSTCDDGRLHIPPYVRRCRPAVELVWPAPRPRPITATRAAA